ncbi:unnamed protein product [Allacma fusca]|uniref:Nostrin n=1 Tax=Allacma fusca TaxID=39272 RepID=A0A8J2KRT7_9HEXA|nr:unnamed protein product [Allacma fusca]
MSRERKVTLRRIKSTQGQNEFEDLRRLVKQGGDFCKDLATVLQERSELEAQYSKGLAKLSSKLLKASKEATGTVAHAWQAVAVQIDTQAELHRLWSVALQEEVARPLKTSTETQTKIRKSVEVLVDKTTRNLAEWRTAEAKAKRQCFSSSKEFEKLQESNPSSEVRSRLLSVPPPDPIKLEAKKRKAEETSRRADIEYYTFCVRSERARLEWESSIRNGSTCLRTLEEEKLTLLKDLALKYFHSMNDLTPKLTRSTEVLEEPIKSSNIEQDMQSIVLRRHAASEQLLPDFYAEDTSNLMRKERRIEALHKCLFLIKQDLDRERKGTVGVENLAKAIAEAPKIDNSHHDISDKLYYMKSMLLYLEAARLKLDITLADIEGRPKPANPLVQYLRHQRDKQGLPQTILKVPSWARDDCLTPSNDSPDWGSEGDRQVEVIHPDHDTDFDEFSSEAGSSDNVYEHDEDKDVPSIGKCRVLYDYDKNLFDELTIRTGDLINIHDKQEDGWWLGELKGTVGIFPATYVEELESSE